MTVSGRGILSPLRLPISPSGRCNAQVWNRIPPCRQELSSLDAADRHRFERGGILLEPAVDSADCFVPQTASAVACDRGSRRPVTFHRSAAFPCALAASAIAQSVHLDIIKK